MLIRLYNTRILTLEKAENGVCAKISEGEIWCEGDEIALIGVPDKTRPSPRFDREIDLSGKLCMAGFKNAHAHSAMTFLRSLADDLPLREWLETTVFPAEERLSGEDIYNYTTLACLEYISGGITSVFDMYFLPFECARAFTDCGMRAVLCGTLNDFKQSLEELDDCYCRLNGTNPLIKFHLGFHAEYTTSQKLLEGISELAHKHRAPIFMHSSETRQEVDECIKRYKKTPTELFCELGIYDFGGGGHHCNYFSARDMELFASKGLSVVTNPASNLKLASGICPVCEFTRLGINVGIGTDGAGSNNCLDMFREMYLTTALQKLSLSDPSAMPAEEVLYMATTGGALAMSLPECTALEVGKKADIIALSLDSPNMQPLNNIARNIVYSGSKQNVFMTMVAGRVLYFDGEFSLPSGLAPEEIYERVSAR